MAINFNTSSAVASCQCGSSDANQVTTTPSMFVFNEAQQW